MFNSTTKMNKAKPKGFNLFDGDTSSDDDELPRAPTKSSVPTQQERIIPRSSVQPGDCAGQFGQRLIRPSATSGEYNMPDSGEFSSTQGSTRFDNMLASTSRQSAMAKNFSAKPSDIPESKPPNVKDAIAQHIDDNIKPRSSVHPGYAGEFPQLFRRQRYIRPSTSVILQRNQVITSGEYVLSSSQGSTRFDNMLASTSRVDASQLRRGNTLSVKQQTDAAPRQTDISGGNKLGIALYAIPGKGFSFKHKNGRMISIHKNVLGAQSPYFFQQFYGNPGGSIDTVLVDDFDPEVVSLAVKACYQQHFDESALDDRIAEQLYIFATKYDIGCVKALLPLTSTKYVISADTVCSVALRSYETNDRQIRQECAAFIASLITEGIKMPDEVADLPADFSKAIILAIKDKF